MTRIERAAGLLPRRRCRAAGGCWSRSRAELGSRTILSFIPARHRHRLGGVDEVPRSGAEPP